jgi:hypothetical protein
MKKILSVFALPLFAATIFILITPKAGCACIDAAVWDDGTVVWLKDDTTVTTDWTIKFKDGRILKPGFWTKIWYHNYLKKPNAHWHGSPEHPRGVVASTL